MGPSLTPHGTRRAPSPSSSHFGTPPSHPMGPLPHTPWDHSLTLHRTPPSHPWDPSGWMHTCRANHTTLAARRLARCRARCCPHHRRRDVAVNAATFTCTCAVRSLAPPYPTGPCPYIPHGVPTLAPTPAPCSNPSFKPHGSPVPSRRPWTTRRAKTRASRRLCVCSRCALRNRRARRPWT